MRKCSGALVKPLTRADVLEEPADAEYYAAGEATAFIADILRKGEKVLADNRSIKGDNTALRRENEHLRNRCRAVFNALSNLKARIKDFNRATWEAVIKKAE